MVFQPYWTFVQKYVITSSLALSCLWSASLSAGSCPTYVFSDTSFVGNSFPAPAAAARALRQLDLQQGLLKPQFEAFLLAQFPVDVVDWQVSAHYQWPSAFRLSGVDAEHILEQLTQPYKFKVTIHANRTAVVGYQFPAGRAR